MKLINSKRVLYLFGFVLVLSLIQANATENKDNAPCDNSCQGKKIIK